MQRAQAIFKCNVDEVTRVHRSVRKWTKTARVEILSSSFRRPSNFGENIAHDSLEIRVQQSDRGLPHEISGGQMPIINREQRRLEHLKPLANCKFRTAEPRRVP